MDDWDAGAARAGLRRTAARDPDSTRDGAGGRAVFLRHTSQVGEGELRRVRELLDSAFEGDFGEEDFEHALGGMHVLVYEGEELVAHGSVVQRRVLHAGRALRTGYVEAVAVRADRRRSGLGGVVMQSLEGVLARAYPLGALSASDVGAALYAARGWRVWGGEIGVLGPDGPERLPEEEGSTYVWAPDGGVLPDPAAGPLRFDWRDGDVL
ncbi:MULTISPECIES: GNAT family N-acetyltransferase [unclassified Streptomyces]|uniref:GNAT family N-acetyltransferase n=1 Tax=unclassified Streptomyces TaxID=2593676 RepID=UPI000DC7C76D|nr:MULTISPECIES: GNAT family N-acetyltransferase [unclassified Streptomyces]AWZ04167.1 aminoglycoside 2'-N-acetyltransferase [Streptomyces sp. ICC4]AWZ11742.1 aminoglycoside 2'-N-acetyltransferase [Streptomyces sp. ICC1]